MIGKPRKCRSCGLPMSVYNDTNLCMGCVIDPKEVSRALKEIKGIANGKIKPNNRQAE